MNTKEKPNQYRTYDYVVLFTYPSLLMNLTDDGWVANGYLPVEKNKVADVYRLFFKPQESWHENILYSQTDELEFSAYFDDDKSEKVDNIVIRVDLKHKLSKERVVEIAKTIFDIGRKLELLPFNVYKGEIMYNVEEVFDSICNSPKGRMYGYK